MPVMEDREVFGYLIRNGCTKFFCNQCADHMSESQRARAIPVYSVKDAPIGTLCYICCAYLEEFGELDEDDPWWDDEYKQDDEDDADDDDDDV